MDVLDLVNDTNQVGPGHDFLVRPFVCKFDDCDRAFARKSDLARHFRIHTNERPFVCVYRGCGKAFIQRSALTVHTRVHTGERPHHCETCNKAFADSSSLARHRRIHTGKRPYGCKVNGCGRQFARRNTYLKHFKRQHPDLPPPTSSSVRALHIPNYSSRPYLSPGSVPPSGSDGQEYGASPTSGHPHPYAAPHPPENAYAYNGGFVNGMLHSSQLAPNHANGLRPYFHAHPDSQNHMSSLGHNGPDHQQAGPAGQPYGQPGDQVGFNGLGPGDVGMGNGHDGSDQSVFSYQDNNGLSRIPSNSGINGNAFYYKPDNQGGMRQFQDPNMLQQQGPWGNVGGGFAPSQLSLPPLGTNLPAYQGQQQFQPHHQDQKANQHSPISDRGNSPEGVVDMNGNPVKYGQPMASPYPPIPTFTGLAHGHMPSPVMPTMPGAQPSLHAVPPQMQRFHSAPVVPTINSGWHQFEQFKATTPGAPGTAGFDTRPPLRPAPTIRDGWQAAPHPDPSHESEAEGDDKVNGAGRGSVDWNPAFPMVRGNTQFRYPSGNSGTNSPIPGTAQAPQTLPGVNVFPTAPPTSYFSPNAPNGWTPVPTKDTQNVVAPNMLVRQPFTPTTMAPQASQNGQVSPTVEKVPMRDRQPSGVSSVGFNLSTVTFEEGDASGDEDDKPWTPSNAGSPEDGDDDGESDDDDEDGAGDDDSDDEFVLAPQPKRKNSTGKRGRSRNIPGPGNTPQRPVLA